MAIVDVNTTVTYADLLAQRRVTTLSAEIDLGVCPGGVIDIDRSGQLFVIADLKAKRVLVYNVLKQRLLFMILLDPPDLKEEVKGALDVIE